MDWLIELVVIAALAVLTAFIIIFVVRKRKKRANISTRLPNPSSIRRKPVPVKSSPSVRTARGSVSSTHRLPRPADDLEYLSYRKCPACRTVNTKTAQYIFKIGENRFECKRCGEKFDL